MRLCWSQWMVIGSIFLIWPQGLSQTPPVNSPQTAHQCVVGILRSQNASPQSLAQGERCAAVILAAQQPASIGDAEWAEMQADAHKILGWASMRRGLLPAAESEFVKSLESRANDGEVSYWLGEVISKKKGRDWQNGGLFHYARAAAYAGPGALDSRQRAGVAAFVTKAYIQFHGSDEGLDQLLRLASEQPFPPMGYRIKSAKEP